MMVLAQTQINIFAFITLAIIFFNIQHRLGRSMVDQQLFLALISANALTLLLDTLTWILNGAAGARLWYVLAAVHAFHFAFHPLVCLLWLFYVDYQLSRSERYLHYGWLAIPAAANILMSILSVNGGLLFTIDAGNVYHRGPYFPFTAAVCYFYLFYGLACILQQHHKKQLEKKIFFSLITALIPPFIGGFLQLMLFGTSLTWPSMTISALIIFINLQNDQLSTDHLTGLFNRRQLDRYLAQRAHRCGDTLLVGVMIDLDCFKRINDLYGHLAGDQALEHTARILRKTFRQNDFISRYGGDEFVIFMEIQDERDVAPMLARLHENVEHFNHQDLAPYIIDFSIGWDIYDPHQHGTAESFLQHIDAHMYRDKQRKELAALEAGQPRCCCDAKQ